MTPVQARRSSVLETFASLLQPRTIAVVGASAQGNAQGNRFIQILRQAGFDGAIYPIHPSAKTIEGLTAYQSLACTPERVDYAFIAVAGERVPTLLAEANGRVAFAQVMSSGFGETVGGHELEIALAESARRGGMRLLGPNCMGTHCPRGRLSFVEGGPDTPGAVGVMSQSGGLAIDVLLRGRERGLRFSAVISLGNCADLGANDFLEYFLADPNTKVIGAYLEHVVDGRQFFEQLRRAGGCKPVVILKGGRTREGQRAAMSHTGSLSDNVHLWTALARQTGVTIVETFEEFVDVLVAFQTYKRRVAAPTQRVLLFGNGGGASVLATDYLARFGLDVAPLDSQTAQALAGLKLPAGASVANPIDVPANVLQRDGGKFVQKVFEIVAQNDPPEAILMHVNLGVLVSYRNVDMLSGLVEAAVHARKVLAGRTHLSLALRSNGDRETEGRRRDSRLRAMSGQVAVFDDLPNQARAVAALYSYERFMSRPGVG